MWHPNPRVVGQQSKLQNRSTASKRETAEQMLSDAALVYLTREVWPEIHTRVLTQFVYDDRNLLKILGDKPMLTEMPFIQELLQEKADQTERESMVYAILQVLTTRFDSVPEEIQTQLQSMQSNERLKSLISPAAKCMDLEAFRLELANRTTS